MTVYLDDDTAERVRQVAVSMERSQSGVVREVLRGTLKPLQRSCPKGVGAYRSGRSKISENAEDLLRQAAWERRSP